ncbi:MAG: glycine--tRNA ligase subunit beta [Pseudomonadota bacterium]
MAELLFEIFSEEIPARMQQRAAADLAELVTKALGEARLEHEPARHFATPRRLTLVIDGLAQNQPDLKEERKGPKVGAPDKAVEGFARSAGLAVGDLVERDTDKGPCWFAVIERVGRVTGEVLAEILPAAMVALPWPKSMRWGDHDERWVRPMHRITALFDGVVVPFAYGPVTSGNETEGHRFLAPGAISVTGFADYEKKLRDAKVVLDGGERRGLIEEGAARLATDAGLAVDAPKGLFDEIAGLVEWPVVLMGSFTDAFMEVPPEVLVSSMTSHQRYLPVRDKDGKLAPRFIFAANAPGLDEGKTITGGNERVLNARLADARHFWDQDRKRSLADRIDDLSAVVFHAKLGTVADKTTRLIKLARRLAESIPGCDAEKAARAANLAKVDLTTEMVGEFPDLQGLMGSYYARHDGEDGAVATAIAEHYAPQGPGDACPSAPESVAVALADKIDTLVGFFAMNEKPTGSKDPYALRRGALGIIRLIVENNLRLPLAAAFHAAGDAYPWPMANDDKRSKDDVVAELLTFIADRLKVHLRGEGVRHDLIDAVFAESGEDDLVRLLAKVEALSAFLSSEDGANLLTAYRRAGNIVKIEEKKDGVVYDGDVDAGALQADEEMAVVAGLAEAANHAEAALGEERFADAMAALSGLRAPVDAFFDEVTVNCDDAGLRENRLRLLSGIRHALDRVADFSRIEG